VEWTKGAAIALAGALLLAACRGPLPLLALPDDDPRPDILLADWIERSRARQALAGSARLAVDAPGQAAGGGDLSLRSRQRLLVARPARLRVEILGFLGTTAAVLATDGEHYELFRAGDRSFDSGPVHDALLWEVARLDLTPEEAVDVILGVPPDTGLLDIAAAYQAEQGRVRIALADGTGEVRRQVEFDVDARLRWLQVRDHAGDVAWEARFDDYRPVAGEALAHSITLEVRSGETVARLSLRDLELNPELSPELFTLRGLAPAGPDPEGG
jgi:hypothetical protein